MQVCGFLDLAHQVRKGAQRSALRWQFGTPRVRVGASLLALAGLALLLSVRSAHAAGNGTLDAAISRFIVGTVAIEQVTVAAGMTLFASLAGIDLIWSVGWSAAEGIGIAELLALVARQLIGIGFFWWLLTNGATFGNMIIQGFATLGGQASAAVGGVTVLSPSTVFNAGANVVSGVWQGMSWDHPLLGILLVIAGVIMLFVFARLAAMMIEVIVESAIMTYAGLIMLGFGGTSFTRDHAIAYYRFCISVGFKRMILQILIGLGVGYITQIGTGVQAGISPGWDTICYLIALPLVMWQLCEKLPYRAQDLINGAASHGGTSMATTAVMVGNTIGQTVVSGSGFGAAAINAGRLAGQQTTPSSGGIGGAMAAGARFAGSTAANFGAAAGRDVMGGLSGQSGARFGERGWRMADDLGKRAEAAAEAKPATTPSSGPQDSQGSGS